jgi:tRNA pseudouridine38-40 synthase
MMRNILLILSYLGTPFAGWQKTKMLTSIEEALENALKRILKFPPQQLQAASRTDAGVHASAQVVNFFTESPIDLSLLKRALNGTLPKEISVLHAKEMPLEFHPTLDALKKEYRYYICNTSVQLPFHRNTSWHVPQARDLDALQCAAHHLLGIHDFSAFCNERKLYDRNLVCHLEEISLSTLPSQRLCLSVIGDHFLYKMMRNIVGTLVYVGKGKLSEQEMLPILQSKQRTRAGMTAPAHGLCLHRIYYKDNYDCTQ